MIHTILRTLFSFPRLLVLAALLQLPHGPDGTALAQAPAPGAEGRPREVIAVRASGPIRVDGVVDEAAWNAAQPAVDFVQRDPREGQPATEVTEVRVLFDDEALYLGVKAFDREPEKIIMNTLEQDFVLEENDGFSFYMDTFHDKRNGYAFFITPAGAKYETQFVVEGKETNLAWEDVWDVKTTITDAGWFAELRVPFRSLRFSDSVEQTWGINFQRRIRRKNEQSFWSPLARRYTGYHISSAGVLKGLEIPERSKNLRLKPYIKASASKLRTAKTDGDADAGIDFKYGLTPGLTLDATINTDFSQVEVDEQQINLTRFSLFFPEKREFFLENAGIFSFGQTEAGSSARVQTEANSDIMPFFSRRIGLSALGQPTPIWAGARVTGHQGEYSLGLINIQSRKSGGEPGNNFTVARVKRNILQYSEIGALLVNRQADRDGDYNRTFGVDASFRFWNNLRIVSFLAGTQTPKLEDENSAGRVWAEWKTNLLEVHGSFLDVGQNFNAEVGFVPRRDIRKSEGLFGLHPRLKSRVIREFFPNVAIQYFTDHAGRLLTRLATAQLRTDFQNGGSFTLERAFSFERLDAPFFIRRPIFIDTGDHNFNQWSADLRSNPSQRYAGSFRYVRGEFWDGKKNTVQVGFSLKPHYKFSVTGRFTRDNVHLLRGDFLTRLVTTRLNYSFSTRMFLSALLQYNSDTRKVSSNIRFDLIHRPLSDIFLVYNEQRDAFQNGLVDRSLTLKYTHVLDLF